MKKFSVLFLLLFAFGISFTSCTKDFEDGGDYSGVNNNGNVKEPITESGKLQVDFDGKTFVSNSVQAIVTDDYISIIGLRSTKGDVIMITIPSNKIGTYTWKSVSTVDGIGILGLAYNLSSDEYGDFVSASDDEDSEFFDQDYKDTASITISSINTTTKKISGTFQFTGGRFNPDNSKFESKIFTNGSFTNISYTENVPIEEPDHFLNAKIDGVDFVEDKIDVTAVRATGVYPYYSIVGKKNRDNEDSIGIGINKSYSVGTYQVSGILSNNEGGLVNVVNARCILDNLLYTSESGSVTITLKTTTQIEGTFNFVVSNFSNGYKKTITGSFNINIEGLD